MSSCELHLQTHSQGHGLPPLLLPYFESGLLAFGLKGFCAQFPKEGPGTSGTGRQPWLCESVNILGMCFPTRCLSCLCLTIPRAQGGT